MLLKKDKKRPYKSKCKRPDKIKFFSLEQAEKAADNFCSKIIFSSELSSYFCKACNAYHNGHRRKFYNFDYHAGKFINDLDEEYDNTFGRA